MKRQFPGVPILGLTATATKNVIEDVKKILNIPNCVLFKASFNRPNLFYEVRVHISVLSVERFTYIVIIVFCVQPQLWVPYRPYRYHTCTTHTSYIPTGSHIALTDFTPVRHIHPIYRLGAISRLPISHLYDTYIVFTDWVYFLTCETFNHFSLRNY